MKTKTINFVKIRGQIIAPMDDETAALSEGLPDGFCFETRIVGNIRSPEFHRKFFKMLRVAYENLSEQFATQYPDFENFRSALLIACGHFNLITVPLPDGSRVEYRQAKSVAYNELDDKAFAELYNTAHAKILELFGVDYDKMEDFF